MLYRAGWMERRGLTYMEILYRLAGMRPISLHVEDEVYRSLKSLAERSGKPVAELIREAMAEYLGRKVGRGPSLLDIQAHPSGAALKPWTREDLFDEMLDP